MRKSKFIPIFLCVIFCSSFIVTDGHAKKKSKETEEISYEENTAIKGDGETTTEETYEFEASEGQEFKRLHYMFGIGGSYFARKDGVEIDATTGAYAEFEYRFSKFLSAGFSTYYGYLIGKGSQYWSSFNPTMRVYFMGYKNPTIEPFIMLGGHAFEGAFGDSDRGTSMGQGGFAGLGFRWFSQQTMFGFEAFARASILYMQRPKAIGGRALSIPIFFTIGFVN